MLKFSVPVPATTRAKITYRHAQTDHFMIGQLPDFIKAAKTMERTPRLLQYSGNPWAGSLTLDEVMHRMEHGDMSAVAKSDKFMSQVEELFPAPTARHEMIDDVVGAFPNVPAFLAGQPLSMRRKAKTENEFQPLAVVVDTSSTASVDQADVHKRGIVILALVRALAAKRPVELWVGCTTQGASNGESVQIFFRIETAPLDLAHAAFLITAPGLSRLISYELAVQHFRCPPQIPSQYYRSDATEFGRVCKTMCPHVSDVLSIPMIHAGDPSIKDPLAWIKQKVEHYTGNDQEAA